MGKAIVKPKSETSTSNPTHGPPQRKMTAKKPRNRKARKLEYKWKDEEVQALIAAVKENPVLWAAGVYSTRKEAWNNIFEKLNIKGIDHVDKVQAKWDSLRSAFVRNNANMKVPSKEWRFAKYMSFLKTIKKKQPLSKEEPSPLRTPTANTIANSKRGARRDMLTSIGSLSTPNLGTNYEIRQPSMRLCTLAKPKSSTLPSRMNVEVNELNNQHFAKVTSTSSPHLLTSRVPILTTTDYNSSFCDHLLTELNSLSERKARRLRTLLVQVVSDFLKTPEIPPAQHFS